MPPSTLLDDNAFIEAGAGTGKSTTLVSRILNTITGPSPVPVTSIAAITFTERAGAELRHRLRERIAKRLEAATDTPADREALTTALQDLDAAPIGTIHSFAQRILRTHALSAGLPLGFAPATGADAADDERSRVRAAVEHLQASLDADTLATLDAYGLSPYDLLDVLRRLDAAWLRLGDAHSSTAPERLCRAREGRLPAAATGRRARAARRAGRRATDRRRRAWPWCRRSRARPGGARPLHAHASARRRPRRHPWRVRSQRQAGGQRMSAQDPLRERVDRADRGGVEALQGRGQRLLVVEVSTAATSRFEIRSRSRCRSSAPARSVKVIAAIDVMGSPAGPVIVLRMRDTRVVDLPVPAPASMKALSASRVAAASRAA